MSSHLFLVQFPALEPFGISTEVGKCREDMILSNDGQVTYCQFAATSNHLVSYHTH